MTKLEEIALAIFHAVTSDPNASWDTMPAEEREDALGWARAGFAAAREATDEMRKAGGMDIHDAEDWHNSRETAGEAWESMVDVLLNEGKGTE
jgi:hypothetical protein